MLIFDIGDAVEWKLIQAMRKTGFKIISKGPDGKQFYVEGAAPKRKGHLDGFILWEDKWWPFDIKSSGSYGFKLWLEDAGLSAAECKKQGWKSFDPRNNAGDYQPIKNSQPGYYLQAQGYMEQIIANKEQYEAMSIFEGKPIGEGFYFFVENKDVSSLYEEFVIFNPGYVADRLLTIDNLHGILKTDAGKWKKPTKKLVNKLRGMREYEVERNKLNFHCTGCPWLRVCYGDERPDLVEAAMMEKS